MARMRSDALKVPVFLLGLVVFSCMSWRTIIDDGNIFTSNTIVNAFPSWNLEALYLPPESPCDFQQQICWHCACPVCYLPVHQALEAYPSPASFPELVLSHLTYRHSNSNSIAFAGSPSLEERTKSFQIKETMEVPCGFARRGEKPGNRGSGFEIQDEPDNVYIRNCKGIVVVSAIFGDYDLVKPPTNLSSTSIRVVCFIMFVDDATLTSLQSRRTKTGAWRIIHIRSDAYNDTRFTSKIAKMLLHRLVPNARFSIWIDGKLQLVVDPIQLLERFLWRSRDTMAISNHPERSDAFDEAEAILRYKRYDNKTKLDEQMEFYRRNDGLVPYKRTTKMPLLSDVPDSCVLLREHTPITNLFSCLWFNEVDRFTPRDQVSFAVVRDKILAQVPWRINMFQDCARRNFVWQTPHNLQTSPEKGGRQKVWP